jgi:diguanylate cyclase (GGDEF)-like protein
MLALAAGLLLWAAGSAVLNAEGQPEVISFPAPGEWLFLAAYVGIAAFLLLDAAGRARPSFGDWLESTVTCGAAAAVAGLLLVTPVADEFGRQGVPLLVALTYPFLDATLLVVLIGQVRLGKREAARDTAMLAAGFVSLGVADASLVVNLASGTYSYGLILDLLWVGGFLLIVEAACRPRRDARPHAGGNARDGRITVLAAAAALAVLTFPPHGEARFYVVIPAVLTLLAAGLRLVLALRDARGAAEAYRLSRTDDLTGLPNRREVVARLTEDLEGGGPLALMLLDLDGFKEINDSLGHTAGDELLQIVARRLRHALPDRVLAARLGGDEFALVLREGEPVALLELAQQMRELVRKPIRIDGLELTIEASVGVALRTDDIATRKDLLRCADVAMYQAKTSRSGALVYDAARDEFSRQRLALAEELRRGLEEGQLVVFYQPQVDTETGRACAVEALVRWRHPTQGLLPPGAFLPAARRAGLMAAMTEVVLSTAVRDLGTWLRDGLDVRVSVNVAPPELLGGTVLPELHRLVDRLQVPADRIIIEVTEDSFLAEPDHARSVISDLASRGMQVSIDDYGTGFSSLSYLRDLPLQELKIDRSFVANILTDHRSWMIVSTTNQLAQGLGLRTVAEGVEDAAQAAELLAMGVDVLQGYHLARPMPADQVAEWIASWRRDPVAVGASG